MIRDKIKIAIRENLLVRFLWYPYARMQLQRKERAYAKSRESERIRRFQNIHPNERCFIIGNGPSLRVEDLNRLKGEYTFATNRIYRLYENTNWRPTYWMCVDPYLIRDDYQRIYELKGVRFVSDELLQYDAQTQPDLYLIYNEQPFYIKKYSSSNPISFSFDCSKKLCAGETVTYNAIQMAVYMGFTEIYLIGVDHSYSHMLNAKGKVVVDPSIKDYFGNVKTETYNIQNGIISTKAYAEAKKICEARNILIRNATRGGKLKIFERVSFDSLFHEE